MDFVNVSVDRVCSTRQIRIQYDSPETNGKTKMGEKKKMKKMKHKFG